MSGYKASGTAPITGFVEFPKWMYHKEIPACVVQDKDEQDALGEEWFEAKGSASAPIQRVVTPSVNFVEYPKFKYHIDGTNCIVQDEDSDSDLGPGWHNTPTEAKEASELPISVNSELGGMNAAQLRKLATDLGIQVKPTWKTGKLIEMIESAKPAEYAE